MNERDNCTSIVPWMIDQDFFCLDASIVVGVLDGDQCQNRGIATGNVVGGVVFEGREIPVIRLRDALQYASECPSREHILLVAISGAVCGFLVDAAFRAIDVLDENAQPIPTLANQGQQSVFPGVVRFDGDLLISASTSLDSPSAGAAEKTTGQVVALLLAAERILGLPENWANGLSNSRRLAARVDIESSLKRTRVAASQFVAFDVTDDDTDEAHPLAVDVQDVVEVVRPSELIAVPLCGNALFGLIQWRSRFVPVVDLLRELGLGRTAADSRKRVVILRTSSDELFAFFTNENVRTIRKSIRSRSRTGRASISPETRLVSLQCMDNHVTMLTSSSPFLQREAVAS